MTHPLETHPDQAPAHPTTHQRDLITPTATPQHRAHPPHTTPSASPVQHLRDNSADTLRRDGVATSLAQRHREWSTRADTVMPGFIRWLSDRQLPLLQRRRYHLAAEQFLCWHTGKGQWHTTHGPDLEHGQRRYVAALRLAGRDHTALAVTETALELLRHYLSASHGHAAEPGNPDEPQNPVPGLAGALLGSQMALTDPPMTGPVGPGATIEKADRVGAESSTQAAPLPARQHADATTH